MGLERFDLFRFQPLFYTGEHMGVLFGLAGTIVFLSIGFFVLSEGLSEPIAMAWFSAAAGAAIWGVWDAVASILAIKDSD